MAALLALIFKKLDDDEDDVGVRYNNATKKQDEEFTDEGLIRLSKPDIQCLFQLNHIYVFGFVFLLFLSILSATNRGIRPESAPKK